MKKEPQQITNIPKKMHAHWQRKMIICWFIQKAHRNLLRHQCSSNQKKKKPFRLKGPQFQANSYIKYLWCVLNDASCGMAMLTWINSMQAFGLQKDFSFVIAWVTRFPQDINNWRVSPLWSIDSRGGITLYYIHNLIWLWFVRCSVRFDGNNCL